MRHISLSLMILALSSLVLAAPLHVVIDPGHGGKDRGARSGRALEAQIVLSISKKLKTLLNEDPEFQVSLTRETDRYLTLTQRSDKAEKLKADLFLSIHANSSPDPEAQGREIYFQNQLPPDEEALFLANLENQAHEGELGRELKKYPTDVAAILADLERNHRIYMSGKLSEFIEQNWRAKGASRKRPIRQAPFHVISNVNMPSVLIETGYVTNPSERKRLLDSSHQSTIAHGLYQGLKEYKDFVDSQPKPHLN